MTESENANFCMEQRKWLAVVLEWQMQDPGSLNRRYLWIARVQHQRDGDAAGVGALTTSLAHKSCGCVVEKASVRRVAAQPSEATAIFFGSIEKLSQRWRLKRFVIHLECCRLQVAGHRQAMFRVRH